MKVRQTIDHSPCSTRVHLIDDPMLKTLALRREENAAHQPATSSVDYETDAKITSTINECFEGVTMLVIAHRLATIMHL